MKTTAAKAAIQVLKTWNTKYIYGIPGSSVNGLMDALGEERDAIGYIQVRHESAGAMAAAAHAKSTREIGVCFGSAAPGGANLINGLYDAKMDRVPLLALVGQVPTPYMNTNFFQEMDEIPLYADVSVYNRTAANAAQIPHLIEEAIRTAYAQQGVAVVILPNDLMEAEIEYEPATEQKKPPARAHLPIHNDDVQKVLEMIHSAERPVFYGGLGLRGARDEVVQVSETFSLPIVTSATAIGVAAPSNHKNFMGSFGRLGTKPAFEVLNSADLVLFVGSNFPFARYWPKGIRVVQINNEIADIGKQIPVEMGIVADAKEFLQRLLAVGKPREETSFLKAARTNKQNWDNWLNALADDDTKGLSPEGVLKAVREHAADDAFFGVDVGNNSIHSVRMLPLYHKQRHVLSGWFATLGVALPYAMAAKLHAPNRQVWSIQGEGGFAMNMQEIITQARYGLPIINILLDNGSYGFIQHAQILSDFAYGVDLPETDWAMAARGMGAEAFTVSNLAELRDAMDSIEHLQAAGNRKPILLHAKIYYADPLDTSGLVLDPDVYPKEKIDAFKKTYNVFGQPALSEIVRGMEGAGQE